MKKTLRTRAKKSPPDSPVSALQALKRAAKQARVTARMYGTKIHFMRNGKIVSEKP